MHIAIFGCGQLAQMTAQAGKALGLRFSFIADKNEDTRCVDELGAVVVYSNAMTASELYQALGQPDVITVEKEMVDAVLLEELHTFTQVSPGSKAIYIAQNRIREKIFLRDNGIATAEYEVVSSKEQLSTLPERLGYPIYIKAAESGYDGYHQWRIQEVEQLVRPSLIAAIEQGVEIIAEKHVDYVREISVIAARNSQGECAVYPLMANRHEAGVLLATIAPAPKLNPNLESAALEAIQTLLTALDYVGVLTLECFETTAGLVANEIAPRVHNSGHWTIEGSQSSQFENHCRAIAGLALGNTQMGGLAGLVNMLGQHGNQARFSGEGMYYHAYGKQERAGRKLGHITVCSDSEPSLVDKLNLCMSQLYGDQYALLE